jgi:hypothetical protein
MRRWQVVLFSGALAWAAACVNDEAVEAPSGQGGAAATTANGNGGSVSASGTGGNTTGTGGSGTGGNTAGNGGAASGGSGGTPPMPASCSDSSLNGDETGLDCGGSCAPCPNGEGCASDDDCQSALCQGAGGSGGAAGGNAVASCAACSDDADCATPAGGSCDGGNNEQTSDRTCDAGNCVAGTTSGCTPYLCGSDACLSDCSSGGHADCIAGYYCQTNSCVTTKANGLSCSDDAECTSSYCVDGHCCDTPCAGECDACDLSGSEGSCSLRADGAAGVPGCDPYLCDGAAAGCPTSCVDGGDCTVGSNCNSGECNGKQANGNSCSGNADCVSNKCVDGYCCDTNCTGNCEACNVAGALGSCTPIVAGTDPDNDCGGPTSVCDGAGNCKTIDGAGCNNGSDCVSGYCPSDDGVCCDSACSGLCEGCLQSKTGMSDGTCALVTGNSDPDGECTDQGAASCGANGMGCRGDANACILYANTIECAAASCSGGVETPARNCDGAGTCTAAGSSNCGAYACNGGGSACLADCTGGGDADCAAGYYCDATDNCVAQKIDGDSCSNGSQCQSGNCPGDDGVCCDSACSGLCQACLASKTGGSDGMCDDVSDGTDPDAECSGAEDCTIGGLCTNGALDDRLGVSTFTVPEGVKSGVSNWRIWGSSSLYISRVYTAPLDNCQTLVCFTTGDAGSHTARLAVIDADDQMASMRVLEAGRECRGLAAEPDGHYGALLWDKAGDKMYLKRFAFDGMLDFNTELVATNVIPDDFNIGGSRLAYGSGSYGAYYHVHGIGGFMDGHEGDALMWVQAATGVASTGWNWGCSHQMSALMRFHPTNDAFLPVCATDCYPGTVGSDFANDSIGGIYLNDSVKVIDMNAGCNGRVAGELGSAAISPMGYKLVFNAHQNAATMGQSSYDPSTMNQDIGFVSIDSGVGSVVWLTNTSGVDEADASIARFEPAGDATEQYLAGWLDPGGGPAYRLTRLDAAGSVIEGPIDIAATAQWGRRDDPFRQHVDGDVVWAWFDAPGSTTLNFARVEAGNTPSCASF